MLSAKEIVERIFFLQNDKTLKEFSSFLNVSEKTLKNWKYGASLPQLVHLIKLNTELGIPSDWLLTGKSSDIKGLCKVFFNKLIPIDEYDYNGLPSDIFELSDFFIYTHSNTETEISFLASMIGATLGLHESPLEVYCKVQYELNCLNNEDFNLQPDEIENIQDVIDDFDYEHPTRYTVDAEILTKVKTIINEVKAAYISSKETKFKSREPNQIDVLAKDTPLPDIAPEDFREIPFYPDEIAAGQPLEIRDAPEGIVIIHKDWCRQPEHMVAVRVSSTGTSMEPTIPAGAIVTIDTSETAPKPLLGQPVAIYKKDEGATIKRLAQTTRGWCGIPDNRDPRHQVIMIEEGDRIIGKVNSVHYSL